MKWKDTMVTQYRERQMKQQDQKHEPFSWSRLIFLIVRTFILFIAVLILIISLGSLVRNIILLISNKSVFNLWSSVFTLTSSVLSALFLFAYRVFPSLTQNFPTKASSPALFLPSTPVLTTGKDSSKAFSASQEEHFFFNAPLLDAKEFYGRKLEWYILRGRVLKKASTSLIGPRRIGKTWLMNYLQLVALSEFGSPVRIGYIDATAPSCATTAGFVHNALKALSIENIPIGLSERQLTDLENAVQRLVEQHVKPVLCIDEFEYICVQKEEFGLNFFTSLRSLAGQGLCLVIASKTSLQSLIGPIGYTSGFFNIIEPIALKEFTEKEAKEFVQAKGEQIGLNEDEQVLLLEAGKQPFIEEGNDPLVKIGKHIPVRLQLAGTLLLQDKKQAEEDEQQDYDPADADYKKDFEERLNEIFAEVVE